MNSSQITNDISRIVLQHEIEEFFCIESELLDDRRYEEWLDLLSDDIQYYMPVRRNVKYGEWERENTLEGSEMSWFEEGKATLTQRVKQLATGIHWAEEPASRVTHLISNVHVIKIEENQVTARSRFIVYRNRVATETDFLVGKREDTLKRLNGQWRLARRKILLDQNVMLAKSLTVFL